MDRLGCIVSGPAARSVLIVSGTRPEVIKLAPLYHVLQDCPWADVAWLHTGQHDAMAEQMLECFRIAPQFRFAREGDTLAQFSAGCRLRLDDVMRSRDWSCVLVQGDTESTFLGALAGFHAQVPVGHVEAGLRTHDLARPFPEEGIRQMITRIARFHFAPTHRAAEALAGEGLAASQVFHTGNTVVDAQLWARANHGIKRQRRDRGHLLVTMHRRENWGAEIEDVCAALVELAQRHPQLPILFPVHLNPTVQVPVRQRLGALPNVRLTAPLDYLAMQQALADAWLVLTDSGGIQEEAPTYQVPVLVLRRETERPELIECGGGALVGTARADVVAAVERLLADASAYRRMQVAGNPFGDGQAAQQIVHILERALGAVPARSAEPALVADGVA